MKSSQESMAEVRMAMLPVISDAAVFTMMSVMAAAQANFMARLSFDIGG